MAEFISQIPDDRITCGHDCARFARASSRCRIDNAAVVPDLPRRCEHFRPAAGAGDPRTGAERWPHLVRLGDENER